MDQTKLFAPRTRKAKRLPGFNDPKTASKAGKAGKGQAKRRGDEAYYKALSTLALRARWNSPATTPEDT